MGAERQAGYGVSNRLGLSSRGIRIDRLNERSVHVDLSDSGPLITISDPADGCSGECEGRARAGIHRQLGAAAAVEASVVHVPVSSPLYCRVRLLNPVV